MADLIKLLGFILFILYILCSLWLFINAMAQLHLLWYYKKGKRKILLNHEVEDLPFVTVQLPVYNEKFVIERLLTALTHLDYPSNKWEIQILDDSTDETVTLIDKLAHAMQAMGLNIQVLRRPDRKGYKAGALEYGMQHCRGELIAIFDADFIPPANFLMKLVLHFSTPDVGMVQARWEHLNKEENSLTRIQTFLLDTHFSIEQVGRTNAGYFSNFCGTAGIWRKQCIQQAGGWDGSVLSEDLDLSYRAQLKGWRLVYDPTIEVPAELPSAVEAFKVQQFRWTKGMAQTFSKNFKILLRSPLSVSTKVNGAFHLLSSTVFLALFISALLTLPLLIYRNVFEEFVTLTQWALLLSVNLLVLTIIYYQGACKRKKEDLQSFFAYYPLFLVVYMGLSVQNSVAVLQGLWGIKSPFLRTPKFASNALAGNYLPRKINWINWLEGIIFCYFLCGIGVSFYLGDHFYLLFFCMMSFGLGYILFNTFADHYRSMHGKKECVRENFDQPSDQRYRAAEIDVSLSAAPSFLSSK